MKTIFLQAQTDSDLVWSEQVALAESSQEPILWEMDFGFNQRKIDLSDSSVFFSLIIGVEEFSKAIWPHFKDKTVGIVLYKGSLDIIEKIEVEDDEIDKLATATGIFADYLQRLSSFLPEEIRVFCLFEPCVFSEKIQPSRLHQLTSYERFSHIELSVEKPEEAPTIGVCLPPDSLCDKIVLAKLDEILYELNNKPYRIIPESLLNQMWDGIDLLIVIEDALTHEGKRKIKGFIAAGGEVKNIRSRGI